MTQRRAKRGQRPVRYGLAETLAVLMVTGSLATLIARPASTAEPEQRPELYFEDEIAPLLQEHCTDCHNADASEAGLDLTKPESLVRGSDSGSVMTPRNRDQSLLYEVVHSGEMPPDGEPLADEAIERIGDWIAGGAAFRNPPPSDTPAITQHDVIPILLLRCVTCHGAELQRGGLDLRTVASVQQGGENGPAAVVGDPDQSPMIQRAEEELCPPQGQLLKYFVERPSSTELQTLRDWITDGMPEVDKAAAAETEPAVTDRDREHWAFQPLPKQVPVPRTESAAATESVEPLQPIDAFIERRLRENGLEFSPPASRTELIRRVHLDLIGLPPTLEALDHWERHPDDRWYEQLVDELLASPHYGERWGRYWLDVAGYADSEGGQSADTVRAVAWKYRDYVIRSLNDDKPWDRFLHEQLAGDELADFSDPDEVTDSIVDNLIATGFLRMTVDETGSRTMNFVPERLGLISDALNVVASGVMGVTMECARCHNHKYDPISQSDFFRFKAIFQGAFDEHDWMSWKKRKLEVASPEMIARHERVNSEREPEIKQLQKRRKSLVRSLQEEYHSEQWPMLEKSLQEEIEVALKARDGRRTLRQEELVSRYETEIRPVESVLIQRHPEFAQQLHQIDDRIAELEEQLLPPLTIRALWDRGRPSPTYVLIRGEYDRPGHPVGPAAPPVLEAGSEDYSVEPPWPGAESTGRRLAFARWLTAPDHPTTARVLVNRVWSHHFGRGIVKTLDNFGAMGAEPSHPDLLDWLARDFVDGGWSLKSLHRTILLSQTYRQSSKRTPERDQVDPENALLSRMSMRRLDAEAIRDSILAVSGRLDEQMYGPPSPITARDDGLIMERPSRRGTLRRTIYVQLRRTQMPSLLSVFDYPEMQPNCSERTVSTVSTQSLVLVNNARIHRWAGDFAERVLDQTTANETDPESQWVRLVYRMALGRSPTPEEQTEGRDVLAELRQLWRRSESSEADASRRALTTFCHTIINSAEFLYVD